jgi:4-phytase / acid phosphatase
MCIRYTVYLLATLIYVANVSSTSPTHVIVVSRHGVRTPFSPTGGDLEKTSFQPYSPKWKEFPVTAEEWDVPAIEGQLLTNHGKLAITRMGSFFGDYYSDLLSKTKCEDLFFYADNCTRDVQTATAFLTGMSSKCAKSGGIERISLDDADILFNQGGYQTPQCRLPGKDEIDALVGGNENDYGAYKYAHTTFIDSIQNVINCCSNKQLCQKNGAEPCTLSDIPMQYTGQYYAAINGSVYLAGYFSSYFMLAALNNMTIGLKSSPRTMSEVTDWYHWSSSTLNIVDSISSSPFFASTLASHILASLQQASTGKQVDGLLHDPETKFVYMAGHDVNLVLLRTLLDLTWLANGWKRDDPSPGGMLLFELYDDGAGGHDVEIIFQVATPNQIRNAEILTSENPPSRTSVLLPGCQSLRCPLSNFTKIVLGAIKNDCVGISKLQAYVNNLAETNESQVAPAWEFIVGAVGLVIVTTAVVAPLTIFFTKRKQRRNSGSYLLAE